MLCQLRLKASDYAQTQRVAHHLGNIMDYKDAFKRIFAMPDFPRVRANDPLTSFQAADSIKEAASQHHQTILECLQTHGPLGKDGISAHTNLDGNQVARRLNEMKIIGLIELTGNTVKSNSGRNEREWQCIQSV